MQKFKKILKTFFEPVRLRPVLYLKYAVVAIVYSLPGIIHVFFLERITFYLQAGDKIGFNNILKNYIFFILFYEIINFSLRKWGWMATLPLGVADMYKKYLRKYIELDNNKIETIGTGKLIGIIKTGVEKWIVMLADLMEKGTALLITFAFSIYMIVKVKVLYGFLFFLLFFIFIVLSIYFNSKLIVFRKKRYEYRNIVLKYLVKILMNKQEIMQSNKIDREMEDIYKYSYKLKKVNQDMGTFRTLLKRVPDFGIALILFFSFYFLGNQVFDGKVNLNLIVGLSGVLIIMQKTIMEAVSFYVRMTKDFVDVEKMWDFFNNTKKIKGYKTGKNFEYKKGKIEIKNLTYSYVKNKEVFKNFNLKLKPGKITAFVGNSGSGKSTLVKLITGYIRANSGEIIVDGQKLSETKLKSYYKNIGFLTQEPPVFDGTILENLTYGVSKKVDQNIIKKVIKQAKCEFIYELEKGLETEIGERGVRLSGGQKQRLAIAKIMLKDPKIIFLDEPTSALDSFSEEKITYAMHNLFKGRTVIIIAHRLQTVKETHDIILLENGQIKERGTHKELVKQNGQYKKMLDLQTGF